MVMLRSCLSYMKVSKQAMHTTHSAVSSTSQAQRNEQCGMKKLLVSNFLYNFYYLNSHIILDIFYVIIKLSWISLLKNKLH